MTNSYQETIRTGEEEAQITELRQAALDFRGVVIQLGGESTDRPTDTWYNFRGLRGVQDSWDYSLGVTHTESAEPVTISLSRTMEFETGETTAPEIIWGSSKKYRFMGGDLEVVTTPETTDDGQSAELIRTNNPDDLKELEQLLSTAPGLIAAAAERRRAYALANLERLAAREEHFRDPIYKRVGLRILSIFGKTTE